MPTFKLFISYNQISFFLSKLKSPFNDWSDIHISQGFAWRKESVSFATIQDGESKINLDIAEKFTPPDNCIRAISVPFVIPKNEVSEIASISDSIQLQLPDGNYQLIFQIIKKRKLEYSFTLIKDGDMKPDILIQDKLLTPTKDLLMKAKAAN